MAKPLERKRGIRHFLRRAFAPDSTPEAVPTKAPPGPASSAPDPTSIHERALARLSTTHQSTLEAYLSTSDETALRDAHAAAQKCQRQTEHGALRRRVERVVTWIDRFKAVGDVVSNADPIHVGLPWAGIRLIIQVALAERRQREDLMRGLDIALDFSSRVRVYLRFLRPLPASPERDLIEKELVGLYALILAFLAQAIEVENMRTHEKIMKALVDRSSLDTFEADTNQLGQRVETAAQRCESQLRRENWEELKQWVDTLRKEMGSLDEIRQMSKGIVQLHTKMELDRLTHVKGASFDSYEESQFERYLAGTRVEILKQIMTWVCAPDGKPIFWLCGKAGTGKSTIARTIAEQCKDDGTLGASFFFKRSVADRSHAKLFFPTVTKQLSLTVSGFNHLVAQTLDRDPMICERKLLDQFEDLLLRPLEDMHRHASFPTLLLIVDALDECADSKDVKELLTMLARLSTVASMRIFVTSRPELPVDLGFQNMHRDLHHDVILEYVQTSSIRGDLSLYFQHRLDQLKADDLATHLYQPLPQSWPGGSKIEELVLLAEPLFLAAFTICEFISQSIKPEDELDLILAQRERPRLSGLATIYLPILAQLLRGKSAVQEEAVLAAFRQSIGPLILFYEPLSGPAMSTLLGIPLHQIDQLLRQLKSVIDVPRKKDQPIRIFHLSFRETLLDPQLRQDHRFWINESATHRAIAISCLRLLSETGVLKNDICGIKDLGRRRVDVSGQEILPAIAPQLAYACQYWVAHVKAARMEIDSDLTELGSPRGIITMHAFLRQHLLHWIEVMAWLNRLPDLIHQLAALEDMATQANSKKWQNNSPLAFLQDARRFVVHYRQMIDTAPLQLYYSALIYAPRSSLVKHAFEDNRLSGQITANPWLPDSWGPEKVKLLGHSMLIVDIAFSPDGQLIATSSNDMTIRLWDAHTGDEVRRLHSRHIIANSIVFTVLSEVFATGKRLSNSGSGSIVVWDASNDLDLHSWKGQIDSHAGAVFSSTDGRILATPPIDNMVNVWNTETFQTVVRIRVGLDFVRELAIHPNGKLLAVCGEQNLMELYDLDKGCKLPKAFLERAPAFKGYEKAHPRHLTFSHREELLAFVRVRQDPRSSTLRSVWDIGFEYETTHVCFNRNIEDDDTTAVAFSPVKQMIAFASKRGLIDLSLVRFNTPFDSILASTEEISTMEFSHDGRTLASGSDGGTVTLWAIPQGVKTQREKRTTRVSYTFMRLSLNQRMLVCVDDYTLRLWDVNTGRNTVNIHWALRAQDYLSNSSLTDRVAFRSIYQMLDKEWIETIAFAVEKNIVALGFNNQSIELFHTKSGGSLQRFLGHENIITALAITEDGRILASVALDSTIRIWNTANGEEIYQWGGIPCPAVSIAISSDGNTVIAALSDCSIWVWNINRPDPCLKLGSDSSESGQETIVTISYSGDTVAASYDDNSIRLWNVQTGEHLKQYRPQSKEISRLELRNNGRLLETNLGFLDLKQDPATWDEEFHPPDLQVEGDFIQLHGKDELWLPHEYRGQRSEWRPGLLAIAQEDGGVSFYRSRDLETVDSTQLPQT